MPINQRLITLYSNPSCLGLLELEIDFNATDESGNTFLHHAAVQGQHASVKLLLAKGVATSTANNAGQIPLALANENGHQQVAELLSS
jgi:ankyrin repeat protein